MPFAVVKVEIEYGEKVELALPLNLASRELAVKIMRDLGRTVGTGQTFALFIKTDRGDKRIPPGATLGALGIVDGQQLRLRRESNVSPAAAARTVHAYLRTESGELLGLEAENVIIGRKDPSSETPLDLDLSQHDPSHAVSRRHAAIGHEGSIHYLLDLHSTNGTRLNGESILPGRKVPLHDGDAIEFGLGMRVTFTTHT